MNEPELVVVYDNPIAVTRLLTHTCIPESDYCVVWGN